MNRIILRIIVLSISVTCCTSPVPSLLPPDHGDTVVPIDAGWVTGEFRLTKLSGEAPLGFELSLSGWTDSVSVPCYEIVIEHRCGQRPPHALQSGWPVPRPGSVFPSPSWCPVQGGTLHIHGRISDGQSMVSSQSTLVMLRPDAPCASPIEEFRVSLLPLPLDQHEEKDGTLVVTSWVQLE